MSKKIKETKKPKTFSVGGEFRCFSCAALIQDFSGICSKNVRWEYIIWKFNWLGLCFWKTLPRGCWLGASAPYQFPKGLPEGPQKWQPLGFLQREQSGEEVQRKLEHLSWPYLWVMQEPLLFLLYFRNELPRPTKIKGEGNSDVSKE